MSIEKVRAYFEELGIANRIKEFDVSSATVALAAQALGCEEQRIAKTLSFLLTDDKCLLVVAAGDVKVDITDSSSGESLVGKVLQFLSSSEERQVIFEPGATFLTQGFKVKTQEIFP